MKSFSKSSFYSLLKASLISLIVNLFVDYVDSIVAGNMLGETAISSVAIVSSVYALIGFVSIFLGYGGGVLYQKYVGQFKVKEAHESFGTMFIVVVVTGILMCAVFCAFEDPILEFFGCSEQLLQETHEYFFGFKLVCLICPFYYLVYYLVYNDGDAKFIAFAAVVQLTVNLVFSIFLSANFGLKGISIATFLSYVISTSIICLHFLRKKNSVKIKFSFVPKHLAGSIKFGTCAALISLFYGLQKIILNKYFIVMFGEEVLPAVNVIFFTSSLMVLFQAIGLAITPLICIYYSENNEQGVKTVMGLAQRVSVVIGVSFTIVLFVGANFVPYLFGITSTNLFEMAVVGSRYSIIFAVCILFAYLYQQYYLLTGKFVLSVVIASVQGFVAQLMCIMIPGSIWGLDACWIGYGTYPLVTVIISVLITIIVYGIKGFPYYLNIHNKTKNFNLLLTKENLMETQFEIGEFIKPYCKNDILYNKIMLLIEETGMQIMEKNNKNVIVEYSVTIEDDNIRIIERDNGQIFDITDQDSKATSINTFVLSSMLEVYNNQSYIKSSGFNRSIYNFPL